MNWRKWVAAVLPRPLKRAIKRAVCGTVPAAPVALASGGPSAALALAPGRVIEIVPGDIISDAIAASGVWEEALSQRLVSLAHAEGGVLVEVGANIGYFSVLWAAQGPACRVLAFEPAWRNLYLLQRNVASNALAERIEVLPVAAGRALGLARFDLGPPEQTGWGGLVSDARANTVAVVVVPLDDLLPADLDITVLKIDVEGADTWVLEGCRRLLRARRVRHVFYEQNLPRMAALGIDPHAAAAFLASVGYRAWPITPVDHEVVEWEAAPT